MGRLGLRAELPGPVGGIDARRPLVPGGDDLQVRPFGRALAGAPASPGPRPSLGSHMMASSADFEHWHLGISKKAEAVIEAACYYSSTGTQSRLIVTNCTSGNDTAPGARGPRKCSH